MLHWWRWESLIPVLSINGMTQPPSNCHYLLVSPFTHSLLLSVGLIPIPNTPIYKKNGSAIFQNPEQKSSPPRAKSKRLLSHIIYPSESDSHFPPFPHQLYLSSVFLI
ncbi:hypothetical protein ACMFMG_002286 [Clarireedia jacksonii]